MKFKNFLTEPDEEEIKKFTEFCEYNGVHNFVEDYYHHIIPDKIDEDLLNPLSKIFRKDGYYIYNVVLRNLSIQLSGFVLVDKEFSKQLSDYIGDRKVLEIMSGLGTLAYALRSNGTNIKCVDNQSDYFDYEENKWIDNIENIDSVEAIKKYGKDYDILLCSWPRKSSNIKEALSTMREVNPDMVMIYIGELYGGCCAGDDFFREANIIDDPKLDDVHLKRWETIYDSIVLIK